MKRIAFTIVLNGMPFIRKQAEILPKVFDEWHIVEGATLPVRDTAWCRNIDQSFITDDKLSVDGTTVFLDWIGDGRKIFVHRNNGRFWNGKTEMCSRIEPVMEDCILMQFDVDEIWKPEVLTDVLDYAETMDGLHGMLFRCNYHVGPNIVTTGDNSYGNNPGEWARLWRITNRTEWQSHEPPVVRGLTNFLNREQTVARGWVFDHYAYVLEEQVRFKENFYGYTGAVARWKSLQMNRNFPCLLRDHLPWVRDGAMVDLKQ